MCRFIRSEKEEGKIRPREKECQSICCTTIKSSMSLRTSFSTFYEWQKTLNREIMSQTQHNRC